MLKQLYDMVARLDEEIEHSVLSDKYLTKAYWDLCRRRRALRRAIKVFWKTYR